MVRSYLAPKKLLNWVGIVLGDMVDTCYLCTFAFALELLFFFFWSAFLCMLWLQICEFWCALFLLTWCTINLFHNNWKIIITVSLLSIESNRQMWMSFLDRYLSNFTNDQKQDSMLLIYPIHFVMHFDFFDSKINKVATPHPL